MRYAKWGKAGYKLTCYSHQTSKAYLVHDPNCPQKHIWVEDVEQAVTQTLFAIAAKGRLEEHKKSIEGGSVLAALHRQITLCKSKLRRLYDLYAAGDDDTLLEMISAQKEELSTLEEQVCSQEHQIRYVKTANQHLAQLEGLEDVWQLMRVSERRMILASLVDGVTVRDEQVEIKLKYGLS